jgi:hypothetical protein
MSLDQLRTLRRAGRRPESVVVIVGKPRVAVDGPGFVVIDRDPRQMDLTPLIGLPVHLIDVQRDTDRLFAAMDATQTAGAKPLGACSAAGACGVSEDHERAMWRYRETLCPR